MYPLEIWKQGIKLSVKYEELSVVIPKYFGKLSNEIISPSKYLEIAKVSNKLLDCPLTLGKEKII